MSHNIAAEITSAVQSASLNRDPSPHHDLNPSTAASQKRPVSPTTSISSHRSSASIPSSALKPSPRRAQLPPLPEMRFEQSYLTSIKNVEGFWGVAWVTGRDQVLLPLFQGLTWTLVLAGWRYWNRGVTLQGMGWGARVRRWWWGVNGWDVSHTGTGGKEKFAGEVRDVSV